jgi:hypothetical protein
MARRVKEIVEISEYIALDALIDRLQTIRASLNDWASPTVALRGDDFFGQQLTITYLREQTKEEIAIEERYSVAVCRRRSSRSKLPPSAVKQGLEAPQPWIGN